MQTVQSQRDTTQNNLEASWKNKRMKYFHTLLVDCRTNPLVQEVSETKRLNGLRKVISQSDGWKFVKDC